MATSQKQLVVYATTAGYIKSLHASVYATARAGTGTKGAYTDALIVGQTLDWGGNYVCYEGFLTFDTSEIPASASVDAVTMYLCQKTGNWDTAATINAGVTWTPALTTADYVAGASLSGLTDCASITSATLADGSYKTLTSVAGFLSSIAKEGTTAIVLWSSRLEAGTTPTDDEYAEFDDSADANPPKLVVTYTSEDAFADEQSIVFPPEMTRAAAADSATKKGGEVIDWWIEEDEDSDDIVAHAEVRPTLIADIPRDRWFVVSRDTPGASVEVTFEADNKPDYYKVEYKSYGVVDVEDGTILVAYYPSEPTSAVARVAVLNLTANYTTTGAALAHAATVMAKASSESMTAKVTAVGGMMTVDDHFVPAPLIHAGDWIQVLDVQKPPDYVEQSDPAYITGISYDDKTATVTITTGGLEQREVIVPGLSALPAELTPYYGIPANDGGGYYDGGSDDGGGGDGDDDQPVSTPGYKDEPQPYLGPSEFSVTPQKDEYYRRDY